LPDPEYWREHSRMPSAFASTPKGFGLFTAPGTFLAGLTG